jgi:hypothetical protein
MDLADVVVTWTPVTFTYLLRPDQVKRAVVPRLNHRHASLREHAHHVVFYVCHNTRYISAILNLHGAEHEVS